jgi:hypothetical protein
VSGTTALQPVPTLNWQRTLAAPIVDNTSFDTDELEANVLVITR